jgi:hypothetical protein
MSSQDGGDLLLMTSSLVKAELERLASNAPPGMPDSLSALLEYLIRQAGDGVIPDDRMIAETYLGGVPTPKRTRSSGSRSTASVEGCRHTTKRCPRLSGCSSIRVLSP